MIVTMILQFGSLSSALALSSGGAVNQHQGFDTCAAPTQDAMATWYRSSPYWWIGIYIGGSAISCPQPNLTPAWLNATYNQGWRFAPLWVGPQAPCTTYYSRFSLDPSTAYSQGSQEAGSAWTQLQNLGFGNAAGTPVLYDMEAFDTASSPASAACKAAVKSFVQGWVNNLHISPAQVAGVYGSTCASRLNDLASLSPPPDNIWGGDGSGSHTSTMTCVDNGYWVSNQRLKQYTAGHNETYGGVTIQIDNDCANGTLAPSFQYGTEPACL